MQKFVSYLLLFSGILAMPAIAGPNDWQDSNRVILFDLPQKTAFKVEWGNLRKTPSSKKLADRCGTIVIKGGQMTWGRRFYRVNNFIFEADKDTILVNGVKSLIDAKQNSINWDTVESNDYKYTCINGVVNPNIDWVEKDGLKFFKYGKPGSKAEKLYITGFTQSTIRVKNPDDPDGTPLTKIFTTDNCGVLTIRNSPKSPISKLGQFKIYPVIGGTIRRYDAATITAKLLDVDKLTCNRYTK